VIRVLVVDDEAPIRMLCRVNLEAEGMEVIEAADGRAGVEKAKEQQPDLILLGVMMPRLGGWGVAEELRDDQETRDIPIVFLTARSALTDRARGLDLGAVDYVTKPFDPTELAPRVRGLLARLERGERNELRHEKVAELRAFMDAKLLDVVVGGARYPLTFAETAELLERLRRVGAGQHESLAFRLKWSEYTSDPPELILHESDTEALLLAIEAWLLEPGVDALPGRVRGLHGALLQERRA
jgi:two-component system, OmpR family, response regulator RpaB